MSVSPINISRISQNLRLNLTVDAITRNQRSLYLNEVRIAAGRSFVTPSENPTAAARARDLHDQLARQQQISGNLRTASDLLSASDAAISEVSDLLTQVQAVAGQNISNLTSEAEREAEAEVLDAILHQLVNVGNRQFGGRYLFSGRDSDVMGFQEAGGGIAYLGDTESLEMHVGNGRMESVSMPGNELYGAISASVSGSADLTPKLLPETRLEDLSGAVGQGIRKGTLAFDETDGVGSFTVDLSTADTIGDVVELINAAATEAGSGLTATLTDVGLKLDSGSKTVVVADGVSSTLAADLGLSSETSIQGELEAGGLSPRLTPLTPISALAGGATLDLENGLVITNGSKSAVIDLSSAETVQDLLNTINASNTYVEARISADGTSIDLYSRVSGVDLRVTENGGATATNLGLRTFDLTTPLSDMNYGRGVEMTSEAEAPDLVFKDDTGAVILEVRLAGALTLDDVIEKINDASKEATAGLVADLDEQTNGIAISGTTSLGATIIIENATGSYAAEDLGLTRATVAEDGTLIGRDVNPVTAPGVLDAMMRLTAALRTDDDRAISLAAERVETIVDDLARQHGLVGARAQSVEREFHQLEDASISTEQFLSQVEDLDFTRAITELQSTQTVLQASLLTNSRLMNLSLMDYLG